MGLILIPISFAVVVFIIAIEIFAFFKSMQRKKRMGGEILTEFSYNQGPITRVVIYICFIIGTKIKRIKVSFIEKISEGIKQKLNIIGGHYRNMDPYFFIGVQVFIIITTILILFFMITKNVFVITILSLIAGYVPLVLLESKVKTKYEKIFLELPDILDLLTLMVEAGLDFSSALKRIVACEEGVLVKEFAYVQQETRLGKSRIKALNDMSERLNYSVLTNVINSIVLSMKTGSGMASTLRVLSDQFRIERMQIAEANASKAPIKLMFPLIIFIFPTVFVVIFGPMVLSFIYKVG